jgi:hypothetical protein
VEGTVRFRIDVTDDTGVESVLLQIGRRPWVAMTDKGAGSYIYDWETSTDDDAEDLAYVVRVTDTLGNTEETEFSLTVDNPISAMWFVLLAVIVALIVFLFYWQRRTEGMEVTEDEETSYEEVDMEEITADLDELSGIEPPADEFVERVPDSETLASQVEVELEERSIN